MPPRTRSAERIVVEAPMLPWRDLKRGRAERFVVEEARGSSNYPPWTVGDGDGDGDDPSRATPLLPAPEEFARNLREKTAECLASIYK